MANADPERIEEASLNQRLCLLREGTRRFEQGDLRWLDLIASAALRATATAAGPLEAVGAHFVDDALMVARLAEGTGLRPSLAAYAQISLFAARFDLEWLVVAHDE
jgi:hypothetical protein